MLTELNEFLKGLPPWQVTAVVLGLSFGGALLIEMVGIRLLNRVVTRTESELDDVVFETIRWPIVISVALGGVWILTQAPGSTTDVIAADQLEAFFGKPALSIIVLLWAWALNRIVNRVVERVKDRGEKFDFAPVFSNVWTLVVTVGAAFYLLDLWGIEITPLIGAAGIAGIAVGFAAKDTVANFFGGLALYFDDTYKIGDYVVLDDGEAGTVVRVGIRSTTLLTRDEVLVTIPNAVLNAAKIINESAPQRRKRIRVPLGVAYGTDIDAFEALAVDVASAEPLVLDSPTPRMRFRSFGDSALEYELLCWVNNPNQHKRALHNLNRAIYKALMAAEIEIPFPQRDLHVRNGSAVPPERADPVEASADDFAE
ncbi:MAG: mechanosensitive ion channel domain-containing protein [Halobacteriales archaeon]